MEMRSARSSSPSLSQKLSVRAFTTIGTPEARAASHTARIFSTCFAGVDQVRASDLGASSMLMPIAPIAMTSFTVATTASIVCRPAGEDVGGHGNVDRAHDLARGGEITIARNVLVVGIDVLKRCPRCRSHGTHARGLEHARAGGIPGIGDDQDLRPEVHLEGSRLGGLVHLMPPGRGGPSGRCSSSPGCRDRGSARGFGDLLVEPRTGVHVAHGARSSSKVVPSTPRTQGRAVVAGDLRDRGGDVADGEADARSFDGFGGEPCTRRTWCSDISP